MRRPRIMRGRSRWQSVGREPVLGHPVVVEHLRQVATAGIGNKDHHEPVVVFGSDLQGGMNRQAARPTSEDTFFSGQSATRDKRLGVGHLDETVDEIQIDCFGIEVLANSFDEVLVEVTVRAFRVDGAFWVGPNYLDLPSGSYVPGRD